MGEPTRLKVIAERLNLSQSTVSRALNDYQDISKKSVIMVVAAIIYFVAPLDAVPDFLFGWGYLDDLAVLRLVFNQLKVEIEKFKQWKQQN